MSQMITITLPDETRTALDNAANEQGVSQGKDLNDQDVFDLVS